MAIALKTEGLTKQYGVEMIVSAGTAKLLPEFAFRELDLVRVKGKREPVAIYEPIGPAAELSADAQERLRSFAAAVAAFRLKQWDTAEAALQNLKERTEELLYNVYLDRIEQFRRVPPPADWDGVFEHLTK